jgi:hypothetical protein
MATEIEKVTDSHMDIENSLRLQFRFEPAPSALANSSRLMRQFSAIIGLLRCVMNRLRCQFPMGDTVASQSIRHDLPRLILMVFEQTLEEALSRFAISARL